MDTTPVNEKRIGNMAVKLKRNIKESSSRAGGIGQMKTEIHKMEARREQLRHTSKKLSEDLAACIRKREIVLDKARASAAVVEKTQGSGNKITQFSYKHKLSLAKADVARVTKDLSDAKQHLEFLKQEQARLEHEIAEMTEHNEEDQVASMSTQCQELERSRQ